MYKLSKIMMIFWLVLLLSISAFAGVAEEEKTVTAENQFTDAIWLNGPHDGGIDGYLNIWIAGTAFTGTVTLQRSSDNSTWYDVEQWTDDVQTSMLDYERGIYYRLGVKTGDFSGTSVYVKLSR